MQKLLWWFVSSYFILSFGSSPAQSQKFPVRSVEVQSTIDEYESYFARMTAEQRSARGSGYKPFKRWEWFTTPRAYPNGTIPAGARWNAFQDVLAQRQSQAQAPTANWVSLGPSVGTGNSAGRMLDIAFDPNDANVMWAGSASGGLWKTTNGGLSWFPTDDQLPTLAVGCVVTHNTDSDIVYIGTGEGAGQIDAVYGVGVLKSIDGGATWSPTGLSSQLSEFAAVNEMAMHPVNPDILIAATRHGVYRTTDAGTSWTQTLSFTVGNERAWDVLINPLKPDTVFVALGSSGGDINNGIYKSIDNGVTWAKLTNGLPSNPLGVGRMSLAMHQADPDIVYAGISASNGALFGVYKTTDGGNNWTLTATSPNFYGSQGWYNNVIAVDPVDPDVVYSGGVGFYKSTDGGVNWSFVVGMHVDHHAIEFHPGDPNIVYVGNDGGIWASTNAGASWVDLNDGLATMQFYAMGNDPGQFDVAFGGTQDNGTNLYTGLPLWDHVLGGDGMECVVDYTNSNIVYAENQRGFHWKSTNGGNDWVPINAGLVGSGPWVTPVEMNPVNPQALFTISNWNLYKTNDGGSNWFLLFDPVSVLLGSTIRVARSDTQTIYVGGIGNNMFRTTNGGTNWTDISIGLPFLSITSSAVHPSDAQLVYICISGWSDGNHVFRSLNGGSTWQNITNNLPNIPCNSIVIDSQSPESVYVGTDLGVYLSENGGISWVEWNTGLPNVVVDELDIHQASGVIRAATHGRGMHESPLASLTGSQISVIPPAIDFGTVLVGQSSSPVTVTLRSVGTTDLTVSSISDPGLSFVLSNVPSLPLVLSPGSDATFDVTFSPTSPGTEGTITISSDDLDDPTRDVSLTGHGAVQGISLALESFRILDDLQGQGAGNGDGVANGGERIDIPAIIRNDGTDDALAVSAFITTTSPFATITDDDIIFGTVSPGFSFEFFDWDIDIDLGTPGGTVINFDVTMTASNGGPFTDSFSLTTGAPIPAATGPFVLESVSFDDMAPSAFPVSDGTKKVISRGAELGDDSEYLKSRFGLENEQDLRSLEFSMKLVDSGNRTAQPGEETMLSLQSSGNGDGIANGGEIIDLVPTLRNDGNDAFAVNAFISSSNPLVTILDSFASFGTITSSQSVMTTNVWTILIPLGTPAGIQIDIDVSISSLVGGPFSESFSIITGPSLAIPAAATPGDLLGTTLFGSDLLTLDSGTGTGTLIGGVGIGGVQGLAANSAGELLGIGEGFALLRIDPVTGEGRFVARLTNASNGSFISNIEALAFDTNDQLYAVRRIVPTDLYMVDPQTGEMTLIGSTGVALLEGLSFDPLSGQLYASRSEFTDDIYTINTSTGAATLVGTAGFNGSLAGLAFNQSGTLFGVTAFGGPNPNSLININPSTGAGTLVGAIGFNSVSGLTFVPPRQVGALISVLPPSIDFGSILVGQSSSPVTVTILSVGATDLTVSSISDPGLPFVLSNAPSLPLVLSPGSDATFDVTFSPTSPGTEGTITISSDDLDDPTRDVSLIGHGVASTPLVFRVERSSGDVFAAGSFTSGGADLAERINVSEPVEPGDVVELDPGKPGYYRKSRGSSQLVAGVVTSRPGFILGNRVEEMESTQGVSAKDGLDFEASRPMLALMGRVPVKATTENGPIRPADLLTVSNKPGYAMRCAEAKECEGAIIGKALEVLESGEGMILVLVMSH